MAIHFSLAFINSTQQQNLLSGWLFSLPYRTPSVGEAAAGIGSGG